MTCNIVGEQTDCQAHHYLFSLKKNDINATVSNAFNLIGQGDGTSIAHNLLQAQIPHNNTAKQRISEQAKVTSESMKVLNYTFTVGNFSLERKPITFAKFVD